MPYQTCQLQITRCPGYVGEYRPCLQQVSHDIITYSKNRKNKNKTKIKSLFQI